LLVGRSAAGHEIDDLGGNMSRTEARSSKLEGIVHDRELECLIESNMAESSAFTKESLMAERGREPHCILVPQMDADKMPSWINSPSVSEDIRGLSFQNGTDKEFESIGEQSVIIIEKEKIASRVVK
jgi:hypothetical protein